MTPIPARFDLMRCTGLVFIMAENQAPREHGAATLTACLKKVQQMASDLQSDVFATAALDKIAEFRRLRYPLSVLTKCCTYLGATTGVGQWFTVRDALR